MVLEDESQNLPKQNDPGMKVNYVGKYTSFMGCIWDIFPLSISVFEMTRGQLITTVRSVRSGRAWKRGEDGRDAKAEEENVRPARAACGIS